MQDPRAPLGDLLGSYPLVEAFTPMSESCLWSLSADWWRVRGPSAFADEAVPYLATSDGSIAVACAEVIAAQLEARRADGEPPDRIVLFEIGPGSGLFARLALLALHERIGSAAPTPQITYVGIDAAHSITDPLPAVMLGDLPWLQHAMHVADLGKDPSAIDSILAEHGGPDALSFVVCNYVLDSLPTTAFRRDPATGALQEAELEIRRSSTDEAARPFFRMRWSTARLEHRHGAHIDAVLAQPGASGPFNTSALAVLERMTRAQSAVAAIFVNDYETPTQTTPTEPVQSFGGSFATGLHFDSMDRVIETAMGWQVSKPDRPKDALASRSYLPEANAVVQATYRRAFSLDAVEQVHGWASVARTAAKQNEVPRAIAAYEAALNATPLNWSMMTEAAGFLHARTDHHDAAIAMCESALHLNPTAIAAMRVAASCLIRLERTDDARTYLERALSVSRKDPGVLLDFAKLAAGTKDRDAALGAIAEGLALRPSDNVKGELVALQNAILTEPR